MSALELLELARSGVALEAGEIGAIVRREARTVRDLLQGKPRATSTPARWYLRDWADVFGVSYQSADEARV